MMVQFNIIEVSNGFVVTARQSKEGESESSFVWKRVFTGFEDMVAGMREVYFNSKQEEKQS
jgi:hypothetical protein